MEEIYFAGGCLWGVQEYIKTLPGIISTEAGRANGSSNTLEGPYDGYAECVRTEFDPTIVTVEELFSYFFEIIDPCSINQQGEDIGEKYRTGIYSKNPHHLEKARLYINGKADRERIVVQVLPLVNFLRSAEEHQDRLSKYPEDYCHIPRPLLFKYRT